MTEKDGWRSSEAARHHLKTADVLIPGRRETLSIIAKLATDSVPEQPRLLDIGCGHGDQTAAMLELKPDASVFMVDFSEEMLRLAGERFESNPRIKQFQHDLNKGLPDELRSGKFNAAVSCHTVHHIQPVNRRAVYSQVRHLLAEGGIFVIGDRFTGESPAVTKWEFDSWLRWMIVRIKDQLDKDLSFEELTKRQAESDARLGDMPGTIWDMQNDLKQAGFQYVDFIWKNQNMGILAASNG
jgi:ubiquinone/menaquinone biosynthesis C-methylase UbiE